ncbi:MAG: hypothetical protein AB4063_15625 [Crocosphaera sp.]
MTEFGEDDWYGPIKSINDQEISYVRMKKITDYFLENGQIKERQIRWPVIAEISQDFVALSWNGFSTSELTDESTERLIAFPHWNYIPKFSDELAKLCQTHFEAPKLHKLICIQMWDKYRKNKEYRWRHLRIRAEASGVALNAHSAGLTEIDITGLDALSRYIAKSTLESVGVEQDAKKINAAEDAIISSLVKDWGTKSYEFSLDKIVNNDDSETITDTKTKYRKLFKAHCYFGMKQNSITQDSLQHLKVIRLMVQVQVY